MYINEMVVSRDPRWCTSFALSFFLWLRNPPDFSCGFSAHDGPLMVVLTLIFEMTTTINVPGIPLTTQFCHSVFDSSALHYEAYSTLSPRIRELVLCVKCWAKAENVPWTILDLLCGLGHDFFRGACCFAAETSEIRERSTVSDIQMSNPGLYWCPTKDDLLLYLWGPNHCLLVLLW